MSTGTVPARVSDLHKSAFWIYGVTAMVMREPLAIVIRHTSSAGVDDPQVQVEIARMAIVLLSMARVFLASGLYFDQVYLRPDSAARFPRRSYPVDFLAGLVQFLLIVGASTVIAGPAVGFNASIGAFLLSDAVWWLGAKALFYSTAGLLAGPALREAVVFSICLAAYLVLGQLPAYGVLLAATLGAIVVLVRTYDEPAPSTTAQG